MKGLERTTPAATGLPAGAVIGLLDKLEEHQIGWHGIMLLRKGKVVAEGWRKPYRAESPHTLFSLSKSFTSIAVGFAVQEGLLTVEDAVISFFPEHLPCKPCENMQKMKVCHLLTMTTGHSAEVPMRPEREWVEKFLHSYVDLEPGTRFVYHTAATYMLSAILQKLTGETVLDYLTPRLFEPLSITDVRWETDENGISLGGTGLNIKTEDIAKFGVFLQNRGMYEGKRLLNADWIDTATSKLVENYGDQDWGQGYGYQFWQCQPNGVYRADGAFGQYCIVDNKHELVIAVNGGMNDMQCLLTDVFATILPACTDLPIQGDEKEQAELERRLSALQVPAPTGGKSAPSGYKEGKRYSLSPNPINLTEVEFSFEGTPQITFVSENLTCVCQLGYGEYMDSETYVKTKDVISGLHMNLFDRVACAYAWEGETLLLKMINYTAPCTDTIRVCFDEKGIVLSWERDFSFIPLGFTAFGR